MRERDERLARELQDARDELRDAQSQVHNLTADTQKLRARVADKEAAVQKGHVELASTRPRASPLALACISSVSPLHLR